ncbi:ABC transporter substrate-binding protein [Gordonia insulae]|uniref:Aliphatic sulfonates-binding protein n=1 Tax=Gordonia insulae TaxID=2420509 RepID=A0A3G8JQR2_9ACTN|nr:ABC transporter substrate-binding protein [Gordonia insulae]AZG47316.1 Putative aliphatic sulfonates-binding protein [Gordonia insulae]
MTENTIQRFPRRPSAARISRRGRAALAVGTATLALSSALTGCGMFDSESVVVNVGYQSKTINTVNAGTLMRDRGAFEAALDEAGEKSGKKYRVVWQDFSSGAPLTAAMIASHVDIGSMGDYPLLTNGSKTKKYDDAQTDFIATTGYNLRGSLNQVVVPTGSTATGLDDLRGKDVSTSLGSAGDGMLSTALERVGITKDDVHIANQDPSIGAAAVEGKQVDAFAQFVPWPQLVIFRNQGRLVYDGGDNEVPTFHGVVARHQFSEQHPEVMAAFMQALRETTDHITAQPMQAALRVSEITGIEPEVVYLYNGPNGLVSFDPTIKKQFGPALEKVKAYLVKRGSVSEDFDIASFTDTRHLEKLYGSDYATKTADIGNPSRLTGTDEVCGLPVADPATASEVWFAGQQSTSVAATPSCALRRIADTGTPVRAAYVPDAVTATKLFADHATWLTDPAAPASRRYLAFATQDGAATYRRSHPTLTEVSYETALSQSRSTT